MAKENREPVIRKFINDIRTDPTLLSFDFKITPGNILFNTDEVINSGNITAYTGSLLNSFGESTKGIIASPHILLKNLGETTRDNMLLRFIKGFPKIFEEQQWRVQSIEGIENVFTTLFNMKDGYYGSGDEKISISCLEDVDLTMYNLFELYRESVYDSKYKRQIVPNNLLQFECTIEISDKRNLRYYDTSAGNGNNDNFQNSNSITENTKLLNSNLRMAAVTGGGIDNLEEMSNSFKTSSQVANEEKNKIDNSAFIKPTIILRFSKCKFDMNPLNKTFSNINPSEMDNTFATYTFSFSYGMVSMESSSIESMKEWDKSQNNGFEPSISNTLQGNTKNGSSMQSLINGGVDGLNKQYGQDYLDNVIKNAENRLTNVVNKVVGQETGYEVGQNIFGKSNFITAFSNKVGDKLTQFADEGVNKLKESTIGKAKEFINTQKAKVQDVINTAESSLMNGGKKSTSTTNTNKLGTTNINDNTEQTEEKLTGTEKIYTEKTSKSNFESFNIYENVPSGPKQ